MQLRWVVLGAAAAVAAGCQVGTGDAPAGTSPAAFAPAIGPELKLDNPVPGFADGVGHDVATVWNRNHYVLAAWRDERTTEAGVVGDIVAVAFRDQELVDNGGKVLSLGPGIYGAPTACDFGNQFVVTWSDGEDIESVRLSAQQLDILERTTTSTAGADVAPTTSDIICAPLVWLAGDQVMGTQISPFPADPSVAPATVGRGSGSGVLVVYVAPGGALMGYRKNDDGIGPFVITSGPGARSDLRAIWNGDHHWIVVWREADDLVAARIDDMTGAVLGTIPITSAPGVQSRPRLGCSRIAAAMGPRRCLVAWEDHRDGGGGDIYAQYVETVTSLALIGAEIPIAVGTAAQRAPAVAMSYEEDLDPSVYLWQVSWEDASAPAGGVLSALVHWDGSVEAPVAAGGARHNHEHDPAVAAGASGELVVWTDTRGAGAELRGVRYSASGAKLDNTARLIAAGVGRDAAPAVAFDGTNYVAAWSDAGAPAQIRAARMRPNGVVLDPTGIAVSTAAGDQTHPDAAAAPSGATLVVWEDRRALAAQGVDIAGAVIADGVVIAADLAIATAAGDQSRPTVIYDAASGGFVVAWSDARILADPDVYAARITLAGAVLDPGGVALTMGNGAQLAPDLAAGETAFVVWQDLRDDPLGEIYGTRLATSGGLTAATPNGALIAASPGGAREPVATARPDDEVFVAWLDGRGPTDDVYGVAIDADDTVGAPLAVAADAGGDELGLTAPPRYAVAARSPVVYTRFTAGVVQATRAYRRNITAAAPPMPIACTTAAECATGFCVDGFCCDAACGGNATTDCQACSVARGSTADGTCAIVTDLRVCRANADKLCDLAEVCDGSAGAACPADLGRNGGGDCALACLGPAVCPSAAAAAAPHVCECAYGPRP
jgi:hypothetical protein